MGELNWTESYLVLIECFISTQSENRKFWQKNIARDLLRGESICPSQQRDIFFSISWTELIDCVLNIVQTDAGDKMMRQQLQVPTPAERKSPSNLPIRFHWEMSNVLAFSSCLYNILCVNTSLVIGAPPIDWWLHTRPSSGLIVPFELAKMFRYCPSGVECEPYHRVSVRQDKRIANKSIPAKRLLDKSNRKRYRYEVCIVHFVCARVSECTVYTVKQSFTIFISIRRTHIQPLAAISYDLSNVRRVTLVRIANNRHRTETLNQYFS